MIRLIRFNWGSVIACAIAAYVLGLTLKSSADSPSEVHYIIRGVQSLSLPMYFISLAILWLYLLRKPYLDRSTIFPSLVFFLLFFMYLDARLMVDTLEIAKSMFALLGGISIVLFITSYLKIGNLFSQRVEYIVAGLVAWAFTYTILTLGNLLAGYGYIVGIPRFFGITEHPNFAGVALAVASIILLDSWARIAQNKTIRFVLLLAFCCASFLCLLTASRTALGMFLIAVFIYATLQFGRTYLSKLIVWMVLVLSMALFFYLVLFKPELFSDLESVNRMLESGDNRADVWSFLIDSLLANPLFGAGFVAKGKESSYLQALAVTGGFFGSLFVFSVMVSAYYGLKMFSVKRVRLSRITSLPLFVAILFALIIGALVEGFLVELAGAWVFLFLVSSHVIYCSYRIYKSIIGGQRTQIACVA